MKVSNLLCPVARSMIWIFGRVLSFLGTSLLSRLFKKRLCRPRLIKNGGKANERQNTGKGLVASNIAFERNLGK